MKIMREQTGEGVGTEKIAGLYSSLENGKFPIFPETERIPYQVKGDKKSLP